MYLLYATLFCGLLWSPVRLLPAPINADGNHGNTKCGYDNCNLGIEGMINVHLVPHTHDDVGWLKTVDQYYYGSRSKVQRAGVQYILDSVVSELLKDPTKKFIYVEVAFFWRWWNEQHDSMRHAVKGLVNNGQLEFILGGWCMNDEATTHYSAIIDQHTLGFQFLKTNFGDCAIPRTAWQIDPFGHSREQAALFAQMGFDSLYFGRLDYQEKSTRAKNRTMEMMWRGSDDLGAAADLFTGVLWNGYSAPRGFCFDILCNDEPIMDDERMADYNVEEKVTDFLHAVMDQAKSYRAGHIMLTMGDDFNYQDAKMYFKNLDKLIRYVNAKQASGSKVNLLYSTPSCYTYAKNKAVMNWPTKSDDFFPYAESPHSFWTGYFTSRATLKYYTRVVNGFFQAIKQMDVLAKLGPLHDSDKKLDALRRSMGVLQHHDAVSGTERQDVAYDYAQRLSQGVYQAQEVVQDVYNKLMPKSNNTATVPTMMFCSLLNISKCAVTETNKQFQITLYNSVGRQVTHWVRLPVIGSSYQVVGPDSRPVKTQVVPVSSSTLRIPERKGSVAKNELVFQVTMPPLGFSTYFVTMLKAFDPVPKPLRVKGESTIKNEYVSLTFGADGFLTTMENQESNLKVGVNQKLQYYESFVGNNSQGFRSSGAYIFRPKSNTPTDIVSRTKLTVVQGDLVQEVHQDLGSWSSQVVRLYKGERYAEVEWTVGPIPVMDGVGKEVVSTYKTGINNADGVFYTDANGRQMMRRQVDYRASWSLNQTEEVAGNYYPINSKISIKDAQTGVEFAVLTDRSQGGGCSSRNGPGTGRFEVMIQRRLLHDDALGANQALNETGADGRGIIVRGKHYIVLEGAISAGSVQRDLAMRLFKTPLVAFTTTKMAAAEWTKHFVATWSGLNKPLPPNVNLLTLEHLHGMNVLLRLEHFYQNGEDKLLSQPVTVSLTGLFAPIQIASVTELTLGANQNLKDAHRLQWRYDGNFKNEPKTKMDHDNSLDVTLKPMQIRTFEVTLQK